MERITAKNDGGLSIRYEGSQIWGGDRMPVLSLEVAYIPFRSLMSRQNERIMRGGMTLNQSENMLHKSSVKCSVKFAIKCSTITTIRNIKRYPVPQGFMSDYNPGICNSWNSRYRRPLLCQITQRLPLCNRQTRRCFPPIFDYKESHTTTHEEIPPAKNRPTR